MRHTPAGDLGRVRPASDTGRAAVRPATCLGPAAGRRAARSAVRRAAGALLRATARRALLRAARWAVLRAKAGAAELQRVRAQPAAARLRFRRTIRAPAGGAAVRAALG